MSKKVGFVALVLVGGSVITSALDMITGVKLSVLQVVVYLLWGAVIMKTVERVSR